MLAKTVRIAGLAEHIFFASSWRTFTGTQTNSRSSNLHLIRRDHCLIRQVNQIARPGILLPTIGNTGEKRHGRRQRHSHYL